MILLEEVCHEGWALRFQSRVPFPVCFLPPCFMLAAQDLSSQLLFLWPYLQLAAMIDYYSSDTISPNKPFLLYGVLIVVFCHSNIAVTHTDFLLELLFTSAVVRNTS